MDEQMIENAIRSEVQKHWGHVLLGGECYLARAAHSVIAVKVAELEATVAAFADGADKCAEAPHFIVQPFLAIFTKHGAAIASARRAALAPYPERQSE